MDLNQKQSFAFLPMAIPFGISEKTLISLTTVYPYRLHILLGFFIWLSIFMIVKSIVEGVRIKRGKKNEAPGTLRRKIAGRLTLLSATGYVFWRLYDLHWVYFHRWPIAILFVWLFIAGLIVWIFGRWGKRGIIEGIILSLLIGTLFFAGFIFKYKDYRPSVVLLILMIVTFFVTAIFRKSIASRLALKKRWWPVLFCFGAFFFAPVLVHPALRIANDPPKFGAVTLVPGTGGMEIQDVAVSRPGRMLYFTTRDKDRGLGRINLNSDKPVFDTYGFSNFKALLRYNPGDILAAGAQSSSGGEILLFEMDPPKQLGRFSLPIHSMDNTAIDKMVTTRKYMFATALSAEGVVLLTCPYVNADMIIDSMVDARCFKTPLEIESPGILGASDFVNRVLVGSKTYPLGITSEAIEVLALILKEKGTQKFEKGALSTLYGETNKRMLMGRPFQNGIDLLDTDTMNVITTFPGPPAVNALYNRERLLVGGSFLEGQIVIYNLESRDFRKIYVGPGVSDIDFNKELNDLFVATSIGVMRVDLDLLFEHPFLW